MRYKNQSSPGDVVIAGTGVITPTDLARRMGVVINDYDETLTTPQKRDIKAAILLYNSYSMEIMCDGAMPAALVSNKHSAIIGVPGSWNEFRRHCNRFFLRLAENDLLNREPMVPTAGKIVLLNGNRYKFSSVKKKNKCSLVGLNRRILAHKTN